MRALPCTGPTGATGAATRGGQARAAHPRRAATPHPTIGTGAP
jgi:hypothetical protein